ncbi:hypothetical protein KY495_02370 [Massilia sp. PAMC28688]|uniref:hypothetical protein n=1 Tax=Massilia sp. PAMC28688 TaxID=2861283 RepID=UPI001C63B41C|nr:hypothetical protein [Massilia sp. PAMC28688]QYF94105.1 hypothetical protein KY495_02370 [Massilia sp. PAMC28688]
MDQALASAAAAPSRRRLRQRALASVALLLVMAHGPAPAAPSTFGPVIGSAVLCRSHLDNAYFHAYLSKAFGPSYKHAQGAYWFKAEGTLWGTPVSEIMVSDDSSDIIFVGAVTDAAPDKLAESIRAASGVGHQALDASKYPVRASRPGSKIVYFNSKSKIYCAKYKPLPILR